MSTPDPDGADTPPSSTPPRRPCAAERATVVLLAAFALAYPWIAQPHAHENNRLKFLALTLVSLPLALLLLPSLKPLPGTPLPRGSRLAVLIAGVLGTYATILLGFRLESLTLLVALPCVALALTNPDRTRPWLPPRTARVLAWLTVAFLAACFISRFQYTSLLGAGYRRTGLTAFCACVLLFLAARRHLTNPHTADRIVNLLLIGSVPVCLLALWQFFDLHGAVPQWFFAAREPRPMGTLGHTNWFGTYLLLLLPLALGRALQPHHRRWHVVTGLLFASLLVAQTRGAWIGAAFLLPYVAWANRANLRPLAETGAVLAVITLLLAPYDHGRILQRAGSFEDEAGHVLKGSSSAGTGRFGFWKYAARLAPGQLLLGSGLDTLAEHGTADRPAPVDKAHSIYLEYAVTVGAIGTGAYLLWLWVSFGSASWPWRALLGSYLVQGLFIHDTIQTWPLLWLLAALAPAASTETSTSRFKC